MHRIITLFLIVGFMMSCSKAENQNQLEFKLQNLIGEWRLQFTKYIPLIDAHGYGFFVSTNKVHTFDNQNRFNIDDQTLPLNKCHEGEYVFDSSNKQVMFYCDAVYEEVNGIRVLVSDKQLDKIWKIVIIEDNKITVEEYNEINNVDKFERLVFIKR